MKINPRIFGAFLVGAGLIAFAYFVAPQQAPQTIQDPALGVVTAKAPPRAYIEITDTDGDGIPDWSEELRQAEPIQITVGTSSSDVYTSPETLTGRLAVDLLSDTVKSQAMGPFGVSPESSVYHASTEMTEAATDTLYTEDALTISADTSEQALRRYGNNVASILAADMIPEDTRDELEIVAEANQTKDPSVLAELDPVVVGYETARDTMLTMTVPENMVRDHLNLLNAFNALLIDTQAMQMTLEDPLYTMVRLKRYFDDLLGMRIGIENIYQALHVEGIRWNEADTVSQIITIKE